ncbi:STAS domain-containing protein [Streptomyces sp. SAS_270]|uniref:STAS domain-containing protein n=1 Tax=Streptomyces sp. SAS_270 TaxID=3412748 RepID=UPI00403CD961
MSERALAPVTGTTWPPPGGRARLYAADAVLVVALQGDVDLAATLSVRPWLDSVAALRAPGYVVDLRAVTFIDSTGLSMVLGLRRRVTEARVPFGLVCATRMRRLLVAHGTLELLRPSTTLDEALADVTRTGENRHA